MPLQRFGMLDRGVTVVLGEMGVARVNSYRDGQGQRPVHSAWFRPRRPTAVNPFRGRLEVCLVAGGRRPPGPDYIGRWGMEDDVKREQREGSVVMHINMSVLPYTTSIMQRI